MSGILELLARYRDSSDPLIRAAVARLMAYRPLASHAKEPAGPAITETEPVERDGKLPWFEPPQKNAR